MTSLEEFVRIVLIGIGATAVMDLWLIVLKAMGIATLNFALVGRWVGHVCRGQWAHASIGQASAIKGERALGWTMHYATGIVFAVLLTGIQGTSWLHAPSLLPALTVGIATVAVPLFVIQPAMGAGIASSKTPTPIKNCLRSTATHTVFGLGLYLSAVVIAQV